MGDTTPQAEPLTREHLLQAALQPIPLFHLKNANRQARWALTWMASRAGERGDWITVRACQKVLSELTFRVAPHGKHQDMNRVVDAVLIARMPLLPGVREVIAAEMPLLAEMFQPRAEEESEDWDGYAALARAFTAVQVA